VTDIIGEGERTEIVVEFPLQTRDERAPSGTSTVGNADRARTRGTDVTGGDRSRSRHGVYNRLQVPGGAM
jgi:hypothetical protein